jgi:hypothetical protein
MEPVSSKLYAIRMKFLVFAHRPFTAEHAEIAEISIRYQAVPLGVLCVLSGEKRIISTSTSIARRGLRKGGAHRGRKWSESIALGDLPFIERVKTDPGARSSCPQISSSVTNHEPRQTQRAYCGHFPSEKASTSPENALPWRIYDQIST